MPSRFYTGKPGTKRADGVPGLPGWRRARETDPGGYLADRGLVDAVNVALLLGQPLLLTGEPGTGKTQLAFSLAWELNLAEPLKFETKSTSVAGDLFYGYNMLGRFHAAQCHEGSQDALDYLTFNALGRAILYANPRDAVADLLPTEDPHQQPRRSVVLIDEVDKAPRDFPNDILSEIDGMYFRIPELGNRLVRASPEMCPILVVTSNSEKNLPDAFLRRCVYYNIPFPEPDQLTAIVEARLGEYAGRASDFLADAIKLFDRLRSPASNLRKKPATAELLGWLRTLNDLAPEAENPIAAHPELVEDTLSILVKTAEDQARAREVVGQWRRERT